MEFFKIAKKKVLYKLIKAFFMNMTKNSNLVSTIEFKICQNVLQYSFFIWDTFCNPGTGLFLDRIFVDRGK